MKRWNPDKDKEGKSDRPTCEMYQGNRCLQKCRNLIVEPNGNHGCLEIDFKEKMIELADHLLGAAGTVAQEIKRGPGRPPKAN